MVMIFKDKFLVPEGGPYFLTHSIGPMTVKGREYLDAHYLSPWIEKGGQAWPYWLTLMDRFNGALSRLLGGGENEFSHQPNLSAGLSKYLLALPCSDKPLRILMHAHAFPSMGFVVSALPSEGYELVLIPEDQPAHDPQVWEDNLGDDIDIVLITHVHSMTGILSPVGEIARLAKSKGKRVLVDVAQSVGVIPIHIPDWEVDAVFGSCIKWLCGGPGAGWMWVKSDDLPWLEPITVGWFSHANPFEFNIRSFEFSDTAKKFWDGTPSVAPYAMALGGIETILEIGVENIRARNLELLQFARPDFDFSQNGGTICYDARIRADEIENALKQQKARFDRRRNILRLSLHVTNTEEQAHSIANLLNGD